MYNFGEKAGDVDLLAGDATEDKYELCTRLKLNGRIGAPFFNKRYYGIHVSTTDCSLCITVTIIHSSLLCQL